tara:strand:+ start:1765 stop:1956 length:192 start_codon:yes stop_codon:yes gene_type:complete
MNFRNDTEQDVYIDIGRLHLVKPGEVVTLEGAYTCPPLTPMPFEQPKTTARKSPQKTKKKTSK